MKLAAAFAVAALFCLCVCLYVVPVRIRFVGLTPGASLGQSAAALLAVVVIITRNARP